MADVGRQTGDFGISSHGFYFFGFIYLYLPLFTFIGMGLDCRKSAQKAQNDPVLRRREHKNVV
jgi:hypothetical protein